MGRRGVVVLEVGLFVGVLGLPDGGLGVLWPTMRHSFGRPIGDLGVLALVMTAPYLVAGLVSGRTVRAVGQARLAVAVAVVAAAGVAGWSLAGSWAVMLGAVALFGWTRGATDAGLNAYASEHQGVRSLALMHAAYGVGATAAPLAVAGVLSLGGDWRVAVGGLAVLLGLLSLGAVAGRGLWAGTGNGAPPAQGGQRAQPDQAEGRLGATATGEGRLGAAGAGEGPVGAAGAGEGPVGAAGAGGGRVLVILVVFFLYVAAEAGTGAWAYTVLTAARGVGRVAAGAMVASYWGLFTGGRLALAAVGHRAAPRRLVMWGGAVALGALVVFWLDPLGAGWAGLPVAGLALAPIFPVLVALVPSEVGSERAATVIGWSIAAAGVGGPAATAASGLVADRAGVSAVPVVLVLAAVLLVVLDAAFLFRHGDESQRHLVRQPAAGGSTRA